MRKMRPSCLSGYLSVVNIINIFKALGAKWLLPIVFWICPAQAAVNPDLRWLIDGKVTPPLSIDQMLNQETPGSENFLIGLIECGHLKRGLQVQRNMFLEDPEMLATFSRRTQNTIKDRIHRITKEPKLLEESTASIWAAAKLLGDGRSQLSTSDFFINGLMRFVENDYRWPDTSDIATLKQKSALNNLHSCLYWNQIVEDLMNEN